MAKEDGIMFKIFVCSLFVLSGTTCLTSSQTKVQQNHARQEVYVPTKAEFVIQDQQNTPVKIQIGDQWKNQMILQRYPIYTNESNNRNFTINAFPVPKNFHSNMPMNSPVPNGERTITKKPVQP